MYTIDEITQVFKEVKTDDVYIFGVKIDDLHKDVLCKIVADLHKQNLDRMEIEKKYAGVL